MIETSLMVHDYPEPEEKETIDFEVVVKVRLKFKDVDLGNCETIEEFIEQVGLSEYDEIVEIEDWEVE